MITTSTRLAYANGYLELGMVKEAAEEVEQIKMEDQLHSAVRRMRARICCEQGDWKQMESLARRLSEENPDDAFGWINWAYALREMNREQEAKAVAEKGLKLHPGEAVLWFNLACYCSLLGEVEEASEHLDKAIDLESSFQQASVDDPDLDNLWKWLQSK